MTCDKCKKHFSSRARIDGRVRNLCNRRFCLECSPFGLHNTQDITTPKKTSFGIHFCAVCRQNQPDSEFYRVRDTNQLYSCCKTCANRQSVERQQRLKRQAVEYKGGCCERCGYNRYLGCLEFHHKDPALKDFNLAYSRSTAFEKVKAELDQCVLLCANCHREEHTRLKGLL